MGLVFSGELRGYGDFSESATSAVPDRSEIGPYRGGLRAQDAEETTEARLAGNCLDRKPRLNGLGAHPANGSMQDRR
jgi:hypothetical protein